MSEMKRRTFIGRTAAASTALLLGPPAASRAATVAATPMDAAIMRDLVAFTRQSFGTSHPMPFGAAIVATDAGKLLVQRLNEVGPRLDPTCHGEVNAIRAGCQALKRVGLSGYTLYTTGEPCAMCAAAVVWARLDGVVYGATVDDLAARMFQLRIPAADVIAKSDRPCRVTGPVEREACVGLFDDPVIQKLLEGWRPAVRR